MNDTGLKFYSKVLLKGSIAVSVAQATTKILGFLLLPIFTYYLSPTDYGIASMVAIVMTVLNLVYNPGMVSATMRLYHATDSHKERQELFGSAFRFFVFVPITVIFLGLLFGPTLFPLIFKNFSFYPYGFLALILAFFSEPKRIWVTLMTLQYKMHITAVYSVISVVLGMATSILLVVVFKMGVMGKVLGMFPTVLLFFFVSFFTIKKYSQGLWSWNSIKKQLVFGFPLIIAIWSYEILHVADRYILERMTDLRSVGIYTFGYHLAEMPMFLVLGIRQLWNPIFYENMNKGDAKTVSRLVLYYVLALTFINMGVILFSKELILLFINTRYYPAIPLIGVIVLGVYFNGLITISNSLLAYKNKFGITSKIALAASSINIVLNILLIPVIGLMGSALATFIAYLIYFFVGLLVEKETLKQIGNNYVLFVPILFSSLSCLLAFVLNNIYPGKLSFIEITLKSLYFIIFLVFIFLTGWVGKKEVRHIFDLIKNKLLSFIKKK